MSNSGWLVYNNVSEKMKLF